jgi:hypothetical protein
MSRFGKYLTEKPIKTKGWTKESIKKFGETIGVDPGEKGFFDACVKEMSPKEGFDKEKAKGFCAAIKDAHYESPKWRGKGKSKEQVEKDVKSNKFKEKMKEK